ncbi:MAG: hypothetical protein ACI89L_002480 [Phycisphaerales bacterium]|jgi:hypothetical protein
MTVSPQISGLSSQESQVTLQRLADAVWMREGATRTVATATEPTDPTISRESDRTDFEALDEVIKGLGPLVKRLKATAAKYEFQTEEVRDSAIDRALRPFSGKHKHHGEGEKFPGGVTGDFDSSFVINAAVHARGLTPGESIDLSFQITSQADSAGGFVSFGSTVSGSTLRLGSAFQIGGASGSAEVIATSGQTLEQLANAVNSQYESTGVLAVASAGGLVLRSLGSGSDALVSVSIVDAGDADANEFTVYEVTGSGDAAGLVGEGTSLGGGAFTDSGSDLQAAINGESAERIGEYWVASLGNLDVAVNVDEEAIAAAGDGPVDLGTVGKTKGHHGHDDDGHDDHREIRGEHGRRGNRGHHRGHDVREREDDDHEKRTDSPEHGGGLRPVPADDGSVSKVAEPERRLDLEV